MKFNNFISIENNDGIKNKKKFILFDKLCNYIKYY